MPSLPPVPPLAAGFIARPETGRAAAAALGAGATVVLVSDRGPGARGAAPATTERVAAGAREWRDSCGKTQLAISLATDLRNTGTVNLVIWVTATSRASVLSAYAEAAAALGLRASGDAEAVAARLLGWLRGSPVPWLVVLDDVTEAAATSQLWPSGPAGRVLVTTTSPAAIPPLPPGGTAPVIVPVGTYSQREALSYLIGRLAADFDQRQGAADLVSELGDEPLALIQASAVIASSDLSCGGYLRHLATRREQVGAGLAVSPAALTWALSVDHAEVLCGDLVHPQLTFAALLDGNGIPEPLFTAAGRAHSIPDSMARDGLAALEAAGLASVDTTVTPSMVRLNWVVQAAIRAASPAGALSRTAVVAADALLGGWPDDDQPRWLERAFRSCTDSLRRVAGDTLWDGGCHGLLLRAGQSLDALGAAAAAVGYWSDLAATSDRVLGSDHPHALAISERLAHARLAAGRPAEAISWFQWAKGDRLARLGPDAAGTADAFRDLGKALLAAGRPGEAVSVLTDAVAAYDHVKGSDAAEVMSARDDLIAALRAAGQSAEAVWLGRRALADRERVQGGKHPAALRTAQQLAQAYLSDGQAKVAIALLRRVVADLEKSLGPRDPETLAASLDLAHAQCSAGRLSDGTKLLRETAERCELHLPPGDPLTATALESLRNVTGTRLPAKNADADSAPDRDGGADGTSPASKPGRHRTSRLTGGLGFREPERPRERSFERCGMS